MRHFLSFFLLLSSLQAAFEIQMVNPGNIACGGIVSILPGGLNFATVMNDYGVNIQANYSNLYGISALSCKTATISWNRNLKNGYGLRLNSNGDELYNESQLSMGYARKIREPIILAIGVNLYNLKIKDFYTARGLGFDIGTIFKFTEDLSISLLYKNVNNAKLKENQENLPQIFCSGIKWRLHNKMDIVGEIYKDTEYPFITRLGTRIKIINFISAMAGIQFEPDRYSYGINCGWKGLDIYAAYRSHLDLPPTFYFGCKLSIK